MLPLPTSEMKGFTGKHEIREGKVFVLTLTIFQALCLEGITRRGHKIGNSPFSRPSGLYLYREMSQNGSGKTELGMLSRKEGAR